MVVESSGPGRPAARGTKSKKGTSHKSRSDLPAQQQQRGVVKDSFWGAAGAATSQKAVQQPTTEAVPQGGGLLEAKTEVTPKASEEPDAATIPSPHKVEGKDIEETFEDDDEDDLLPEAQPSFPRNEVKAGRFRPNAVHVYGLDFLKTGHMDEIFSQFNHKFVEWINDSSANIVFADAANARKALESLSFPKSGDDPWRRTPDILVSEEVPPIFLQMRLAASTDVKPSKRGVPSAAAPFVAPAPQRRRLYSDANSNGVADAPAKARKPAISEEELRKRRKRGLRFGETQAASGLADETRTQEPAAAPAVAAVPAGGEAAPPAAVASDAPADADAATAAATPAAPVAEAEAASGAGAAAETPAAEAGPGV